MANTDQGFIKDIAKTKADNKLGETKAGSREATRDPKLNDTSKTPGSGMVPDDQGDAPTG